MQQPAERRIATVLVGLGNSGRHYHLPHLLRDDRYSLSAIVTRTGVAHDIDGVPVTSSWQSAIDTGGIDLVVVATPHHLHHPIAAAALDRGISVLVEKPLASTLDEADDLIRRARATGSLLAVHHQRRWEEDFLALRDIVRSGEIGALWRISAVRGHQGHYMRSTDDRPHVGADPLAWARSRAAGGGVLRVIGPHPIDHVLQLAGSPPLHVSARSSNEQGEDVERWAGIDLDFGPRLTGRVEIFRRLGVPPTRFCAWGEDGMAAATSGDRVEVRLRSGATRTIDGLTPPSELGREIYDDVAAALRFGTPLRATALDAREVVRVIELAERSAASGGIPVSSLS